MGITDAGSGTYTAAYTVAEGSADVADGGNVSTSLGFTDAAGNVGATTPTVTLAGDSLDANSPTANFGAATDDQGSVIVGLSSGNTTDDTALVLSGSNEY